jgi:hypothetical protein
VTSVSTVTGLHIFVARNVLLLCGSCRIERRVPVLMFLHALIARILEKVNHFFFLHTMNRGSFATRVPCLLGFSRPKKPPRFYKLLILG